MEEFFPRQCHQVTQLFGLKYGIRISVIMVSQWDDKTCEHLLASNLTASVFLL